MTTLSFALGGSVSMVCLITQGFVMFYYNYYNCGLVLLMDIRRPLSIVSDYVECDNVINPSPIVSFDPIAP